MLGLYFLVIAALWVVAALLLSWALTFKLPNQWRIFTYLVIFLALLPLPLLDEFVAARQFERLCAANSSIQVDRKASIGKTVYLAETRDTAVEGTWVPVTLTPWHFVDATTGEVIVSYNTLLASGGRFIRAIGLSEGGVPLTFAGHCAPRNRPASKEAFAKLGIKYIEPPASSRDSRQ